MEQNIRNLRKPNFLITSKYAASPFELKCTYMAMYKLQNTQYYLKPDGVVVRITCEELEDVLGIKNKDTIYKQLSRTAPFMSGRVIGFVDEKKHEFAYITFINKVLYKKGVLSLRFPHEIMTILEEIKKDYTNLPQKILLSYKHSHTMKLYELLKMKCFYSKFHSGEKNGIFTITENLSELKFTMGVVNSDEPAVKRVLLGKVNPDYDEAILKAKIQLYTDWTEFRRRCLEPAIKEINENKLSDITVSYQPKRNGEGAKVTDIDFTVVLKNYEPPKEEPDEKTEKPKMQDMEMLIAATNILHGLDFSCADIISIAEASNYDCKKLKKLRTEYNKLKTKVDNPVGWFIASLTKCQKHTKA